jgi:hypothetical protein
MAKRLNPVRVMVGAIPALVFALASGTEATAQEVQQGWRALAGCWEAVEAPGLPTLCIVPTQDPAVAELVSVSDDAVVERERIEATGARVARVREGCSGWEQAEWSPDGRRLYTRSEHVCEGGLTRTSSGISSVLPSGEFLNVQGIEASGGSGVRALRYRPTETAEVVRAELEATRLGRELAFETARISVATPITRDQVVEATRHAEDAVVEAWLIEGGASFDLNGARLVELADAGVPGSVIDVMVALSYPQVFAIDGPAGAARLAQQQVARTTRSVRPGYGYINPWFGGFPYDYVIYPGFGFSPFGFGGLGYSPYGHRYGRGFAWYPQRPIVVVRQPERNQGRLVRGQGYTRPGSTGTASAPRPSSGTSSTATTSRSGGSTTSGSSGSASGSSGSTSSGSSGATRTAQPRQ